MTPSIETPCAPCESLDSIHSRRNTALQRLLAGKLRVEPSEFDFSSINGAGIYYANYMDGSRTVGCWYSTSVGCTRQTYLIPSEGGINNSIGISLEAFLQEPNLSTVDLLKIRDPLTESNFRRALWSVTTTTKQKDLLFPLLEQVIAQHRCPLNEYVMLISVLASLRPEAAANLLAELDENIQSSSIDMGTQIDTKLKALNQIIEPLPKTRSPSEPALRLDKRASEKLVLDRIEQALFVPLITLPSYQHR